MEGLWGPVLTAMATPFDADGRVDVVGAAKLARHLLQTGATHGFVVCGTTGEGAVLSLDEKLALWDAVLDAVGDRAAVWASTGSYDTAATVAATRAATQRGVHGLLMVTPYYNKPPQDALYHHFARAAEATDLPVMVYNVPTRTGVNMTAATTLRLAEEVPQVQAIKEAHSDLGQVADLLRGRPAGFRVLSGDDALTFPMVAMGADGVVSVASHVVGPSIVRMIDALGRGALAEAAALHLRMLPVVRALFATTNPIPLKAALELMGLPAGPPRPPLRPAAPEEVARLRQALVECGVLADGVPTASPA
jgi:4-hydroxy-tetrahydrodipicolinate synthase